MLQIIIMNEKLEQSRQIYAILQDKINLWKILKSVTVQYGFGKAFQYLAA